MAFHPSCPLELRIVETQQIGHRYRTLVELANTGSHPVVIKREDEGYPDLFLMNSSSLNVLSSSKVVESYEGDGVRSAIAPHTTESVSFSLHILEGEEEIRIKLTWEPDQPILEKCSYHIRRFIWEFLDQSRAALEFAEMLSEIGSMRILDGPAYVPADQSNKLSHSPLRSFAADFLERPVPPECADIPQRISYLAVKDYANEDFEVPHSSQAREIANDASEILFRFDKVFSPDSYAFRADFCELLRGIMDEVQTLPALDPDLIN